MMVAEGTCLSDGREDSEGCLIRGLLVVGEVPFCNRFVETRHTCFVETGLVISWVSLLFELDLFFLHNISIINLSNKSILTDLSSNTSFKYSDCWQNFLPTSDNLMYFCIISSACEIRSISIFC